MRWQRAILHVDMDAFFAAVEVLDNKEWRGRPVIVGANPASGRGVVAAASYEARAYGIKSAQPIGEAARRCPSAVFVRPRMDRYREVSRTIMAVMGECTNLVEPLSIDEAFLDVTHSQTLFGPPETIGDAVRKRILEATSLVASVGVATSKSVAKIASDIEKPAGFVVVKPGEEASFLAPLAVERIFGVGPKRLGRLRAKGIRIIADLQVIDRGDAVRLLGKDGPSLVDLAFGRDERPVVAERERKSLSAERTFVRDISDRREAERQLLAIAEEVSRRLRREGIRGETLVLKVRYQGFQTVTRRRRLQDPSSACGEIYPVALGLFDTLWSGRPVRLLGMGLTRLSSEDLPCLPGTVASCRDELGRCLDRIQDRFGKRSIVRASLLDFPPEGE